MGSLTYTVGDATEPEGDGHKVICHIVNDAGRWGAGFVLALSKKWEMPEAQYLKAKQTGMRLGETDFVGAEKGITVANMCAQHETGLSKVTIHDTEEESREYNRAPIRYGALATCMSRVAAFCRADNEVWASIHAPRFGAGLSGGYWPTIEALILEIWVDNHDIDVTIYDLPE